MQGQLPQAPVNCNLKKCFVYLNKCKLLGRAHDVAPQFLPSCIVELLTFSQNGY